MIRRAISAHDDSGRFEFQGRFLAHVAQLEGLLQHTITDRLAGGDRDREELIYSTVVRQLNFDRLVGVLSSLVDVTPAQRVDLYRWVLRDLRRLVKIRNAMAHPRGEWDTRRGEPCTRKEAIRDVGASPGHSC